MDQTTRFDLPRKVVASMTSQGWETTPHACLTWEGEASALLDVLETLNAQLDGGRITLNTALLKIIALGLEACPAMNGRVRFRRALAVGAVTRCESVDATVPMLIGGRMVTVTLRGLQKKSLRQIRDDVADVRRRAENTSLPDALYEVSRRDTLRELRHLHLVRGLGRFLGFFLEGGSAALLHGKAKRAYAKLPETEKLTWRDLEQGTVTISNLGALYPAWKGACTLLEIVPPQLCAIGIGPLREQPIADGGVIRVGKVLSLTIAFDHRALDAGDLVPFLKKLDQIFAAPRELEQYL